MACGMAHRKITATTIAPVMCNWNTHPAMTRQATMAAEVMIQIGRLPLRSTSQMETNVSRKFPDMTSTFTPIAELAWGYPAC